MAPEAMLTGNPSEYEQKLRRIIENECDGSRMNNTKWMEMLDALKGLPLCYRVKFLDWPQSTNWRSGISGGATSNIPMPYIEGPSSPTKVLAIEWMEIDPKVRHGLVETDLVQEVEKRLQSVSLPYTWEGLFYPRHRPRPQAYRQRIKVKCA